MLTETRLDALARVGRALAGLTRCRLLLALLDGPAYPSDLAAGLALTRANTSNHHRRHDHPGARDGTEREAGAKQNHL